MNSVKLVSMLAVLASAAAGCGGDSSGGEKCSAAGDCLQGGVSGQCLVSPSSSSMWCAFPDPQCSGSAQRWGLLAGDGLKSTCVAPTNDGGVDAGDSGTDAAVDAGADASTIDAGPQPDAAPGVPVTNGQSPDLVLGQVDFTTTAANSGGESASSLSMPTGIASDGTHLWVGDAANGRVLQWNALPTANKTGANVVLGQAGAGSHQSSVPATAANLDPAAQSAWVWSDGSRICAADRSRNRVLIWNAIPGTDASSANLVLGQTSFTTLSSGVGPDKFLVPRGVYCDATRVIVADTGNSRVLIWSSLPAANGAAASVVIGRPDFTTGSTTAEANPPTSSSMKGPTGVFFDGTRLFVADTGNHRVMVWNTLPTANGTAADYFVGQSSGTSGASNAGMAGTNAGGLFAPTGVLVALGSLFVSDSANHRVTVYSPTPVASGAAAVAVLGQSAVNIGMLPASGAAARMMSPNGLYVTRQKLYVADEGWHRVLRFDLQP